MRYEEPIERVESTSTLESEWDRFAQEQDEPLLYSRSCGSIESFELTSAQLPDQPWIGRVHERPEMTTAGLKLASLAVLINERYAVSAAATLVNKTQWRYSTFGSLGNYFNCESEDCEEYRQMIANKAINIHPNFAANPRLFDVALIEFWGALDLVGNDDYVKPICMPWTESLRATESLQLSLSTVKLFQTESRQLRQLDVASCRQRFVLNGPSYPGEKDSPICTIHSEDERQPPVTVLPGSPLQSVIKFNDQRRYFLRGLSLSSRSTSNVHLPIMFSDIHLHIDWIVERIRYNRQRNLLYRVANSSALDGDNQEDPVVYDASNGETPKEGVLDFNTCGTSQDWHVSNETLTISNPWFVIIDIDGMPVGAGTLISEWYVVGAAIHLQNAKVAVSLSIASYWDRIPIKGALYDADNRVHNIALAELIRPFKFNERKINAICLPVSGESRTAGYKRSQLLTVGWLKGKLMIATVGDRRTDSKNCANNSNNMVCIYSPPLNGWESYSQWVGAPIYSVHTLNGVRRYFLRGFALNSVNVHLMRARTVTYLEIGPYVDWMLRNMNKTLATLEPLLNLQEQLIFAP
uniref:Peptidase S1 domain-containing protein n=1 Tax=Anopheles farauti TaxID=69004 RepID=A0A182QZL2_9DIPT